MQMLCVWEGLHKYLNKSPEFNPIDFAMGTPAKVQSVLWKSALFSIIAKKCFSFDHTYNEKHHFELHFISINLKIIFLLMYSFCLKALKLPMKRETPTHWHTNLFKHISIPFKILFFFFGFLFSLVWPCTYMWCVCKISFPLVILKGTTPPEKDTSLLSELCQYNYNWIMKRIESNSSP